MKSERTRDLQVNRVDNEKSNKIAIVRSLPNNGIEGDEIYRGTPPEQVDMGSGFYKRLEWEVDFHWWARRTRSRGTRSRCTEYNIFNTYR